MIYYGWTSAFIVVGMMLALLAVVGWYVGIIILACYEKVKWRIALPLLILSFLVMMGAMGYVFGVRV